MPKATAKTRRVTGAAAKRVEPVGTQPPSAAAQSRRWITIVSATGAVALFLLVYLLRLDRVVGLFIDDGWYVLLAKAIASGQGYTLINSPTPGIPPLYPPAFPWLLSWVFRLAPEFPQNVWMLKSVSIVAALGVGVVTYFYFARTRALPRHSALAIAVATVLCPALVYVVTSTVMSEAVFMLAQLAAIAIIERGVRQGKEAQAWRYAVPGAACAALAVLIRTTAVGLLAAVLLYLCKERRWRGALIFAVAVVLLIGPWMIYARRHAPTPAQRQEQGGHIMESYASAFWQNWAGVSSSGKVSLSDLPERVWKNAQEVFTLDIGGLVAAPFYRPAELSGRELAGIGGRTGILLLLIGLLAIAGFVVVARARLTLAEIAVVFSLAITVIWPWWSFRYVLPLAPFVIFYILMGAQLLCRFYQRHWRRVESPRAQWLAVSALAWVIVAVSLYDHAQYVRALHLRPAAERPRWVRVFDENIEMLNWMRERLPAEGAVATANPPLVYLYTGRKTVNINDQAGNWENWKRLGVRYLAHTSITPVSPPGLFGEGSFRNVYQSEDELKLRVTDLGPRETRPAWGRSSASSRIENIQ